MSLAKDAKTFIKVMIGGLLFLAIAGYSLFQFQNLIRGPQLSLESPRNGETVQNQAVTIRGTAKNISFISLNDRQIFVDQNGVFKETLLLAPGYNIWKLEAKDKFGRIVSKRIELVLASQNS